MGYKKYRPAKPPKPRFTNNLISQGKSREELEVFNMIKLEFPKLQVYESDRVILHGRELDIWIPSLRLGIEYNGLFYHNSKTKSESYHLWKTIECDKQGIRLIQIFSDEWETKKYLVIDTIKKAIGKYTEIDANECVIVGLSQKEAKSFLEANDLSYWKKADDYIGILYKNEIVSAMSINIISEGYLEIIQYADKCKTKIVGGMDIYLDYINHKYKDIKSITALIDRRVHCINDFNGINFEIIEALPPQTFYTKDFKSRKLLESFNNKKESQLTSSGFVKVNDSGFLRIRLGRKTS